MVAATLFLLAGAVAGWVFWRARASLPRIDGTLTLSGLSSNVEVLRDRRGVPHLYAGTLSDLARANGFVHAQDRLFQMEVLRRLGAGRLAEILGEGALDADREARLFGLAQAASAELARADREALVVLDAYASGVNGYLEAHRDRLPPEFQILRLTPEPWRPQDTLAILKWMGLLLSYNRSTELLRARLAERLGVEAAYALTGISLPEDPVDATVFAGIDRAALGTPGLPRAPGGASNAWVVGGGRTQSGKPLLASDPHLPLALPSFWYQIHLTGAELDVIGAGIPGIPLVLIGHNQRVTWGITALMADVQDHYVETLHPQNPLEYRAGENWEAVQSSTELMRVAGGPEVPLEVKRTRHGIVVGELKDAGKLLALRWESPWNGDTLLALLRLNRASGWSSFTEALSSMSSPPLAFLYADGEGNIGYFPAGDIPVRKGYDGTVPIPAGTGVLEVQGLLPHEAKPFRLNPESGVIVSANQPMAPAEQRRNFGADALAPFRALRIGALIQSSSSVSLADFERIQSDRYDASGESLLRQVLALDPAEDAVASRNLLRAWDGQMRAGPAPAVYQALHLQALENTFQDDLGGELYRAYLRHLEMGFPGGLDVILDDSTSAFWDDRTTSAVESRSVILTRSLSEATRMLEAREGRDPAGWDWERLHGARFVHPLGRVRPLDWIFNRGPAFFGGSTHTVANAMVSLLEPFAVTAGTSLRFLADTSDWSLARSVLPTGASGHFLSRHFFDQNPSWLEGRSHPLPFDRPQVEAETEARLLLTPGSP